MIFKFSTGGTASLRVSADDVVPPRGLLHRDMLQFVGDLYGFGDRPVILPNTPPEMLQISTFQQGRYVANDGNIYPVLQLLVFPNGDAVTAQDTNAADLILDHYTSQLDSMLGYRYNSASQIRYYLSNVVVEFEIDIGEKMSIIKTISDLIRKEIPLDHQSFDLKSLKFGNGDVTQIMFTSPDAVLKSDFTIERRSGELYSSNRYFCSAPMKTDDHIRVLRNIESVIRG